MSFNLETKEKLRSPKYRILLGAYGAIGFLLSVFLTTKYDPVIYDLAPNATKELGVFAREYSWDYHVMWLATVLFAAVYFAPHLAERLMKRQIKNSLGFGILVFVLYVALSSISLVNFGLNPSLMIEFVGLGSIIGSTEFLRGFYTDFTFASDKGIAQQARMRKIELLHKKWFDAIGAVLTVSVAILITGAVKFTEIWQQQFGTGGAAILTRIVCLEVVYAGIGLALGPFNLMFKILAQIENQLEKIESR